MQTEPAVGEKHALVVPGAAPAASVQVVVGKRARIGWASLVQITCTSPRRVRDEKAGERDRSPDNL